MKTLYRVLRGGSWNNNGRNVRSAYRNNNAPDNRNNNNGFRLALAQACVGMTGNDPMFIPSGIIPANHKVMGTLVKCLNVCPLTVLNEILYA